MSEPTRGAPPSGAPPHGATGARPGDPPSLVGLIAQGVLDAELASLIWALVEGRIPLVVATPEGRASAGSQLLAGVLTSIDPNADVAGLAATLTPAGASSLVRGRRAGGVLEAGSLAEVRARLRSGPLPLTDDQLTFLGTVLVLSEAPTGASAGAGSPGAATPAAGTPGAGPPASTATGRGRRGRLRVTAAHYVRPLARDAHGHAQRLDPAVLATWDVRLGRYEHFAWGVLPEIAARLGRRAGDLEADLHHRRDDLAGLAKAGMTRLDEVQRLIAGYRARYGDGHDAAHGSPPN